jgi:hypothetical protein
MGSPGRKRKPGVDRSKGRIVHAQRAQTEAPDALMKLNRITKCGATAATVTDQRFGSALGRMFLKGLLGDGDIAERRLNAGEHYAQTAAIWRSYALAPSPTPRAANLNAIRGSQDRPTDPQAWFRVDTTYSGMQAALRASDSLTSLHLVAILDEDPSPSRVSLVCKGLDALGRFC